MFAQLWLAIDYCLLFISLIHECDYYEICVYYDSRSWLPVCSMILLRRGFDLLIRIGLMTYR